MGHVWRYDESIRMKYSTSIIGVLTCIFLSAGVLLFFRQGTMLSTIPKLETISLEIRDTVLSAHVADTDAKRTQGLSGRESLAANEGMLFIMDRPGRHGIWMKDMRFPIDILWIDEAYHVVTIVSDARPETFPTIFVPDSDARYVLEVPAGFTREYGVSVGDAVSVAQH